MNSDGEFSATPITPQFQTPGEPPETRFLKWVLFGSQGIRVGWSAAMFVVVFFLASGIVTLIAEIAIVRPKHIDLQAFTPKSALLLEVLQLTAVIIAAIACALAEHRHILDYNLKGRRRLLNFLGGLVAGMVALSALVGALHMGGWLHFEAVSLSGAQIAKYGAIWGAVFLMTGMTEEGTTRCYLLFTIARGINYWWALGTIALFCLFTVLNGHSYGPNGVYSAAVLGLLPCLLLQLRRSSSAAFWQAAWLTSTLFGYIHTFNHGETSIGIFSAAFIGFAFCVSVRLTGSAWWAIGFHASWDWAQTFFYGTPDSGLAPQGSYLTTSASGAPFWSGGSTGPEGSVLVIPVVLLVVLLLVAVYGRGASTESPSPAAQPQLS